MTDFAFIPFESFNGAVSRWADQVAGLEKLGEITSHAGVIYGHRQTAPFASPDHIRALAAAMNVDAAELLARATPRISAQVTGAQDRHNFFGTLIPSFLIAKNFRRYAPGAFARSLADPDIGTAYDRAIWHIRLFPFDIDTWEFLLDRCPSPDCNVRPGWQHTLGIDFCAACMADLKKASTSHVLEELRPQLELAVGLVHPDPIRRAASLAALPPILAEAGAATTLDLIMRLIPVVDPSMDTQIANNLKSPPAQLARAVAAAWKIVAGWPRTMNAMISTRIATRTARHSDGNAGRTLRFVALKRIADMPPALSPIVSAWRESISLQGPNRDQILESTRSITDAARIIGLGSGAVAGLRRSGILATIFVLDQNRAEPRFSTWEFEDLERRYGVRTPIDSARQPLGVSWHGVEQLVAMKLLQRETHPFFEARYGAMQIVASSVEALIDSIASSPTGDPTQCTLPLHSAMKAVGKRMKPWGPALAALLDGTLPYVVADRAAPLTRCILVQPVAKAFLRTLKFDPMDAALERITYATHMSKVEAGETLNLGFSQSIPLLRQIKTATGTKRKLVPVHYVLDLADIHISSTELAARRGVTTQRAYHDAIKAGIPDLGPGGFCRTAAEKAFFQ
jgi:hypothetical protein